MDDRIPGMDDVNLRTDISVSKFNRSVLYEPTGRGTLIGWSISAELDDENQIVHITGSMHLSTLRAVVEDLSWVQRSLVDGEWVWRGGKNE
jgi:hypothetical protein